MCIFGSHEIIPRTISTLEHIRIFMNRGSHHSKILAVQILHLAITAKINLLDLFSIVFSRQLLVTKYILFSAQIRTHETIIAIHTIKEKLRTDTISAGIDVLSTIEIVALNR